MRCWASILHFQLFSPWLPRAEKCSTVLKTLHSLLSVFTQQSTYIGGGVGQMAYYKEQLSDLICASEQKQWGRNTLIYCRLHVNIYKWWIHIDLYFAFEAGHQGAKVTFGFNLIEMFEIMKEYVCECINFFHRGISLIVTCLLSVGIFWRHYLWERSAASFQHVRNVKKNVLLLEISCFWGVFYIKAG